MVSFQAKVTNCQAKGFFRSCRLPIGQKSDNMGLTKDFVAAHTSRFKMKHSKTLHPQRKIVNDLSLFIATRLINCVGIISTDISLTQWRYWVHGQSKTIGQCLIQRVLSLLLFPVSNSVCFCLWELQRYPNSETTVFFFLLRFPLSGLVKQGVGLGIRSILVVFDCKWMDVNCLGPTKALRSD